MKTVVFGGYTAEYRDDGIYISHQTGGGHMASVVETALLAEVDKIRAANARIAELEAELAKGAREIEPRDARRVFELIGSIFFNGDFRAETRNKSELESLLRKHGYFFESEEQLLAQVGGLTDTDPPVAAAEAQILRVRDLKIRIGQSFVEKSAIIPITIEQVELEELRQEREDALYLLIHTYLTLTRHSYEDGMTESELGDRVCAFLWNHGLQPSLPEHNGNVRQFLEEYEARARVKLPSAEQILERMKGRTGDE